MRPRSISVVAAFLLIPGCTSTHVVDSNQPEQWILPAQNTLLGEEVVMRTVDGRGYDGKLTLLSADSVKLENDEGGELVAEEMHKVAFVGEPSNVAPPILCGIGGALLGGLIGGAVSPEEPELSSGGLNTVESSVTGALLGVAIGGAAGALIGGFASQADQYEIHQSGKRPTGKTE
jgi:hypothetical protein